MLNTYSKRIMGCRRGRMTAEDKKEIERLATKVKNPKPGPIALQINRHPATVNWFMLTRGLIERKPGRAHKTYERNGKTVHPYSPEHDAFITSLRSQGKVFREIGELVTTKFGIERSAHSVQVRIIQLAAAPDSEVA